jgi:hypothetical protein
MKTTYKILITVLILLLFCFFSGKCFDYKPEIKIKRSTTQIKKENYKPKITGQPNKVDIAKEPEYIIKYIYKDTLILHDTIYKFDTVKIYNDYYTKYFYSDTILNDSNGFVLIKDTIYQNSIYSRTSDVKIHNIIKTITYPKPSFYIGGGVLLKQDHKAIQLNLNHTRRKSLYSVGITSDGQIILNYGYRIK